MENLNSEETSIELVIKEKDSVIEKAENLITEQYGAIQEIIKDTPGIVEAEKAIKVNSAKQQKVATDCLGLTKSHLKIIEERRKICLKPFKKATDMINARGKEIANPLKAVVDSVEDKLRKYDSFLMEEKRKADAEAMKEIEEAAEKDMPIPTPKPTYQAPPKNIKTENTTVTMVDNWKWELLDKQKFIDHVVLTGQIELIDVNQTSLNRLVKNVKDSRAIPGIRVYNHKTIPTRSK